MMSKFLRVAFIVATKEYKIIEKEVMPDHIHLFIEVDPFESPMDTAAFRGVSSLRL
ncbi:MAG: hypothetical protein FJZ49_00130 [Candidatus Verstraetearchaeota archaeon]|nr:hypothetical protein [Candidatus Verstraetearchaeota archaeon]